MLSEFSVMIDYYLYGLCLLASRCAAKGNLVNERKYQRSVWVLSIIYLHALRLDSVPPTYSFCLCLFGWKSQWNHLCLLLLFHKHVASTVKSTKDYIKLELRTASNTIWKYCQEFLYIAKFITWVYIEELWYEKGVYIKVFKGLQATKLDGYTNT